MPKPVVRIRAQDLLPRMRFMYHKFINSLQAKLRSGRLTEEQKIRIFFVIKAEEVKNMTRGDLLRTKKKYERLERTIEATVLFLERRRERGSAMLRARLVSRVRLERLALRQCRLLLRRIDGLLAR